MQHLRPHSSVWVEASKLSHPVKTTVSKPAVILALVRDKWAVSSTTAKALTVFSDLLFFFFLEWKRNYFS